MEIFVVLIYLTGLLQMTAGELPFCCRRPDLETLDCSNCRLSRITLPEINITSLNLNKNFIPIIENYTFIPVKELRHLSLYNNANSLSKLMDNQAFAGLEKLETLDIRMENCLITQYSIFKKMKSLRILKMAPICNGYDFPELPSTLEFLEVAVFDNFVFGQNFSHILGLKTLVLNGYSCRLSNPNNKTFEAFFFSLQTLELRQCLLTEIKDVFSFFQGLKTLNFAGSSGVSLEKIFESIEQMPYASLETLIADGVSYYGYRYIQDWTNFAKLTKISFRAIISTIRFGMSTDLIFYEFAKFPEVQSLNYRHTIVPTDYLNSGYSEQDVDLGTILNQLIRGVPPSVTSFDISFVLHANLLTVQDTIYCSSKHPYFYSDDFFIRHPDFIREKTKTNSSSHSLQFIYARNFQPFALNLKTIFLPMDNVLYIDLSGTWIETFSGVIENGNNLQGLDLRGCRMKSINSTLLDTLPSLIYLNLSYNNLNNFSEWNRLFKNAHQIKTLDLSSNGLGSIPDNIFKGLTSLETVIMDHNYLGEVVIDLTNNNNLKMLDLRNNELIPTKNWLERIDSLQKQITHKLKLNLQDNFFECECNNLFFLNWLIETSVDVVGLESLQCYPPDPTYISKAMVKKLTSNCKDKNRKLIVSLVAPFTSLSILVMMVVLLVRNYRWTIKWKFYLLRRRVYYNLLLKRNDGLIPLVDDYTTYHAFVSYHHDYDYKWVRDELVPKAEDDWGLKLCVGQRDFLAGIPISENICEAIDKSRYVILVITPSFVTSEWCDFEMHMALVKGRRHLTIVYLEDVEPEDMSQTLKALMANVNYIEYNNTPDGNALFWQRLKDKLTSHVYKIDT